MDIIYLEIISYKKKKIPRKIRLNKSEFDGQWMFILSGKKQVYFGRTA